MHIGDANSPDSPNEDADLAGAWEKKWSFFITCLMKCCPCFFMLKSLDNIGETLGTIATSLKRIEKSSKRIEKSSKRIEKTS
jgi:hypothetical protein